jgi:hypothetical protein
MELTNKTLVALLFVTVVISAAGTLISLQKLDEVKYYNEIVPFTGFAQTDTANVTFNINSTAQLQFTINTINFGTGTVNASSGANNCTLTTNNQPVDHTLCDGFNDNVTGLVLENVGTINVTVELSSNYDVNSTNFLSGGLNSFFKWQVGNNETGSCANNLGPAAYTNVNTTAPGTRICGDLNWSGSDTMLINVSLAIDATRVGSISGQRNATFLATGSPAS